MNKDYQARAIESKWQQQWKQNEVYRYDQDADNPVFSIDTPPPTISGKTHMGHVYGFIQQDFVARFKRMEGFEVFYPFGFDNNGIATERFTQDKTGKNPRQVGREQFSQLCSQVSQATEDKMLDIWHNLGISADWNLLYRTISDEVKKKSQLSFIKLYEQGREYKKKGPTLWCPECSTAVSQAELEDKEIDSYFNDLVFEVDGEELIISTTRPELLPACVSVFVHPEDPRAERLAGKKAKVPLFDHEVPIIEDERVERDKGTGIVMCCTFGDQTDMEWYYAHDLPLRLAIDREGRMTELAGKYEGLNVKEAREKIVSDLKEAGLLKDRCQITHEVNTHERCGQEIEFFITEQWFIKILDKKDEFLEAGKEMNWYPEHLFTRYQDWIEGLQWDWCISRQRYFGIPFPVWYCQDCGAVIVAQEDNLPVNPLEDEPESACPDCGCEQARPEKDILDTWATSSLTPLINADWDEEDYDHNVFPMSLRPQGHDIISFWLFHTVVKSLYHTGKVPFQDVLINGMVLDPEGKKMSKSKGNVVVPQEVMADFPADAIRYWAAGSKSGEDLPFKEKDIRTGQKLLTKLWNASRFSQTFLGDNKLIAEDQTPKEPSQFEQIDRWMLSKLNDTSREVERLFDNYQFGKVRDLLHHFFWSDVCDNYLEIAKSRLYEAQEEAEEGEISQDNQSAIYTLYNVLKNTLKLYAPLLPHITEEIYQELFANREGENSIHTTDWPQAISGGEIEDRERGDRAVEIISAIRRFKSEKGLPLNAKINNCTIFSSDSDKLEAFSPTIKKAMNIASIELTSAAPHIEERIKDISLNYDQVGPNYGSKVKKIEQALANNNYNLSGSQLQVKITSNTGDQEQLTLSKDDYEVIKKKVVKDKEQETSSETETITLEDTVISLDLAEN